MALQGDALLADTLFRHLNTLTTVPATVIAWPGINEVGSKPRLEVQFVPNTKRAADLQDGVDSPGFLIVTVVIDEGQGVIVAADIGSQVASHFENITLHTNEHRVRFVDPPTLSQAIPDGSETRLPVSIPFIATS